MTSISTIATEAPVHTTISVADAHTGLRSPFVLGRHPVIGLGMMLIGGTVFSALAINLKTEGVFTQSDVQLGEHIHQFALKSSPLMQLIMIAGYYMGQEMIMAIGLALLVYFLWKRSWTELSMVVIAWLGEGSLWMTTTQYFRRDRPKFDVYIWKNLKSYGFPSGHSLSAVMCYGLLAYLAVPRLSSLWWKLIVVASTLVMIGYIGYSRIFVNHHHPTDVIAGYGLGLAWSGLVYTSAELVALEIQKRKEAVG